MEKMPVICNVNNKDKLVNRSEKYYIKSIDKNKKTVTLISELAGVPPGEQTFDLDYFSHNFSYGFCITVHRMQGDEILEHYNIFEVEMMSKELLYTAIGRGKKLKHVHLKYTDKIFHGEQIYIGSSSQSSKPKQYKEKTPTTCGQLGGAAKKKSKKEPTVHIVQKIKLNKSGYEIRELKDMYIIQYRDNGKKKNRKVRFGKRITKEKAYIRIKKIQEDLRKS
jgi:hypothetical protein